MLRLHIFGLFFVCLFPIFTSAQQPGVILELNKLEDVGEACRIYLLVEEQSGVTFEKLDADFVLFDAYGIIIKRYLVPLAPIAGGQSRVRLFDLPNFRTFKIICQLNKIKLLNRKLQSNT
jgi:hypothetical protein